MSALLAGQSITEVAAEYKLPRSTVAGWAAAARRSAELGDPTVKREIGDLLVEYLRANLEALRAQMKVFGDADWVKKQSASEVGVLHGVCADKAVRLLEAFERGSDEEGS